MTGTCGDGLSCLLGAPMCGPATDVRDAMKDCVPRILNGVAGQYLSS